MIELTCRNHPKARYLTKGGSHSLFFVDADADYVRSILETRRPVSATGKPWSEVPDNILACMTSSEFECPCPASDLIEIGRD